MALFKEAHSKLHSVKWGDFLSYAEDSPTCLKWKNPMRAGNKGTPTPRKSLVAGGLNQGKLLVFTHQKSVYSIPKIVWFLHNGEIPEGYTIWFKDNNHLNAKISNLYISEINNTFTEKYSDKLRDYIRYDETSPSGLRWIAKTSKSTNINIGAIAGSLDVSDGYWKVHGLGSKYKCHRLVWFLHNGKIPKGYHIDHIDRDRANNLISNLRAVPQSINGKNRSKNKNNTTGVNGISYAEFFNHRGTLIRRFSVMISCNGKSYNRSFSLAKYGDKLAWELALQEKERIVKHLKDNNAGFTEDHGN